MKNIELIVSATESHIVLSWSLMSDATGYFVYLYDKGKWREIMNARKTAAKISGIKLGEFHTFKVASYTFQNAKTYVTAESQPVSVIPMPVPTELTVPPIPEGISETGFAELSWKGGAVAADGYVVRLARVDTAVSENEGGDAADLYFSAEYARLVNLQYGVGYTAKVRSFKRVGAAEYYSGWSESAAVRLIPPRRALNSSQVFLKQGETFKFELLQDGMPLHKQDAEDVSEFEDTLKDFDKILGNADDENTGKNSAEVKNNAVIKGGSGLQWLSSDVVALQINEGVVTSRHAETATVTVTCTDENGVQYKALVFVNRQAEESYNSEPPRYSDTDGNRSLRVRQAEIMIAGDIICGEFQQKAAYGRSVYDFNSSFDYLNRVFQKSDFAMAGIMSTLSPGMPYARERGFIAGASNINAPATLLDAVKSVGIDCLFPGFLDGIRDDALNRKNAKVRNEITESAFGIADTGGKNGKNNGKNNGKSITDDKTDTALISRLGSPALTEQAILDTYGAISDSGIGALAPAAYSECANSASYIKVNGIHIAVLYVFCRVLQNGDCDVDTAAVTASVKEARKHKTEFIIAVCNFGTPHSHAATAGQRKTAVTVAECGANYIIGRGSRVVSEYDRITTSDGRVVPVFYSLGALYAQGTCCPRGISCPKSKSCSGGRSCGNGGNCPDGKNCPGHGAYNGTSENTAGRTAENNVPGAVSDTKTESDTASVCGDRGLDGVVLSIELMKTYGDNKEAVVTVGEEHYVPVCTMDEFREIEHVVVPVTPLLMGGYDPVVFIQLRKRVKDIIGNKISLLGERRDYKDLKVRLLGSSLLTRIFTGISSVHVDDEVNGLSCLSLFDEQKDESLKKRTYDNKNLQHNLTKDVAAHFAANPTDYIVVDLYNTVVLPMFKVGDTVYTETPSAIKSAFYGKYKDTLKLIEFSLDDLEWEKRMTNFVSHLQKFYSPEQIILIRSVPFKLYGVRNQVRVAPDRSRLGEVLRQTEHYFMYYTKCLAIDISSLFFGDKMTYETFTPVTYDTYYFEQTRIILQEIFAGERRAVYDADFRINSELWLRRYLYYYDNVYIMGYADRLLNYKSAADLFASKMSKQFIRIYYDKFIEIKEYDYHSLEAVLNNYCAAYGLFREGVAAVISVMRDNWDSDKLDFDVVFDYDFRIIGELIPKIEGKLKSTGIGRGIIVTKANARFMLNVVKYYNRTMNFHTAVKAVEGYYKQNRPVTVDLWGSNVSSLAMQRCPKITPCIRIDRNPFVWAFSPKVPVPSKSISSYLSDRKPEYAQKMKDVLLRRSVKHIENSQSEWIVLDFFDLALEMSEFKGQCFVSDNFFRSTALYKKVMGSPQTFSYHERYDKAAAEKALDDFADLLLRRYGERIILNRIELKTEYIDINGNIRRFTPAKVAPSGSVTKTDKAQQAKFESDITRTNEIIRDCEEYFIRKTSCYNIDISGFFNADDKYPLGGANFAHYEDLFYENTSYYISAIITVRPRTRTFNLLNPTYEAINMIRE